MTLDMYPEDEAMEKIVRWGGSFDIFLYKLSYGYYTQYSRNCLQMSHSGQRFSEVGRWRAWRPRIGAGAPCWPTTTTTASKTFSSRNGIARRPNNMDYTKFAAADSLYVCAAGVEGINGARQAGHGDDARGQSAQLPFQGHQSLRFQNKSAEWGFATPTISNGAAYADFDNDGDLDFVTNNLNARSVYLPKPNPARLCIRRNFAGKAGGLPRQHLRVGAKVIVKYDTTAANAAALATTRGFESV